MDKDSRLTTLVLSGASTNGVVSLGAVQYVFDSRYCGDIVNYVGTSSGSMICALLCVGYTPVEILGRLCIKRAYSKMNPNLSTFLTEGDGLFSFDDIKCTLAELFVEKTGFVPTVGQLWDVYGKNFVCVTVDLTTSERVYVTRNTHRDLLVTDAVHMSSCFPIMFKPLVLAGHTYVDGGIGDNFPVVYSSVFPGRGVCICITGIADSDTYRNVPYFAQYIYNLFKIHTNIIAHDQDVVDDRECFFLNTAPNKFFDFSISRCQLVASFYNGYDELEKTCAVMKNGSCGDI